MYRVGRKDKKELLDFSLQLYMLVICQLLVHRPAIRTIFDE